mgnify:CR=1 FL=1
MLVGIILSTSGFSQVDYRSPYSRYGVGDLTQTNHPVQMSMGGLSVTLRDPNLINSQNAASYTDFDTLSFVFDGGVSEKLSTWESLEASERSEYSSLGYLQLGFPITSRLKTSIGLKPYSNVGYSIRYNEQLASQDTTTHIFEGDGGLNDFYIGMGFEITKGLSLGVNASYTWGTLDLRKYTTFPKSNFYWDTRLSNKREISDIKFDYGLQYEQPLKNQWSLITGFTYSHVTNLSAKQNSLTTMLIRSDDGSERVLDTVKYTSGQEGSITLPSSYGAGIMFEKENRYRFGIDYRLQQWDEFESFGSATDSLKNSSYIAFGAEIRPKHNTLSSYLKKIKYRFGAHYSNTYLQIQDNQLTELGISFGVGLPIKNSGSSINFAVEIGRRGTTDNNLLKENYYKFTLGLAIFERWFLQRKYQ